MVYRKEGTFSLVYWEDKALLLKEDAGVLLVHWEDRIFFFTSIPEICFLTGILERRRILSILGRWWLFTGILGA